MVHVLSVGGSIVVPQQPDEAFLRDFASHIRGWLGISADRKLILVVGGGGPARVYQKVYRNIAGDTSSTEAADWIGIMATRLNAQLLKALFADMCPNPVVYDPTAVELFSGQILIAAGWKPGFSTDNDAVLLAERFSAQRVINLSNIEQVYTDDPKKNPDAKPIETISWEDFIQLVGTEWVPGKNTPFDPVASLRAQKAGIQVICAAGTDLNNLDNILHNRPYKGTTIG